MRALVIGIVLSVCGVARADATTEARVHYRHGLVLFNEGRFEAARVEFEAGYQLQPLPLFLFNAAQAARRADNRPRALELYKKFVAADPQSSQRAEAEQHIAELEPTAPPAPVPVTPSEPTGVAPSASAPALALVASSPPSPRRWSRDPAGGALAGIGAAAAVSGAILVGVAGARVGDAQTSYDRFDAAHRTGPLFIAGGITLGVAAALLIGSAIRYGVVARRLKR